VATVVVATALGHIFFTATTGGGFTEALRSTPRYLADGFVHLDLGTTSGRGCNQMDTYHPLCVSYGPQTVAAMLRERVPVDVMLIVGGLLLGTVAGIAGGRTCAVRPDAKRTKVLHALTALQLSTPVFFQALLVIVFFSSNVSDTIRLPFLSGQGDYAPPGEDPAQFLKAMWVPWILAALPLAAFVLRITEAGMREGLQEDFIRTARAKGITERRVIDRHALPVVGPAIAAMTGVNVSTLLINAAVIEYVYSLPGLFRVINTAVHFPADIAVLKALVIEGVVLVVLANALADGVQARLDPAVRRRS
jgi:peptide/nickel transport system permease protein